MVAVVQLVRASDCGSECRGFESHLPPAKKRKFERIFLFFVIVQTIPPKGRQRGINVNRVGGTGLIPVPTSHTTVRAVRHTAVP